MKLERDIVLGYLGVPLAKPRVALSAASPRTPGLRAGVAVGFPLQSLTRNRGCGLIIIAVLTFSSCGHAVSVNAVSFNEEGWSENVDGDYPQRDQMVNDLLKSHELKGEPLHSVIDLLGEPDNVELVDRPDGVGNQYITYQVLVDFGRDIDPVHTKYLVVNFDKDSIVTQTELLEWNQQ